MHQGNQPCVGDFSPRCVWGAVFKSHTCVTNTQVPRMVNHHQEAKPVHNAAAQYAVNGKDNSTSPGRRARTAGPGALGLWEDGSRHAAPTPYSGSPCAKAPHPRPGQGQWRASVHISPRSEEGPLQPGQRQRRAPTLSRPSSVKGSSTRPRSVGGPPNQAKGSGGPP